MTSKREGLAQLSREELGTTVDRFELEVLECRKRDAFILTGEVRVKPDGGNA